ncbi:MAG TPA: mannose-6-phosphate isomerase [Planctomycetes bacterium]|nr:mannose-6-phosphate isomerase [Planctomycetota bacterium]
MSLPPLEPLLFERLLLTKVWGGDALAPLFGFEVPQEVLASGPVGETWELVDREEQNSRVRVGMHAGKTLRELVTERGEEILGNARPARSGRFPLLVKYIDAGEPLSVQVHPDAEAAASIGGGAEAKTEAWYVLAAEEGACVWAGLADGVSRADFEAALATEGAAGTVELLRRREVQAGDCVLIEGGCVHAIGAGVTILEIQQNSDTTYRIHDWGRLGLDGCPRETHPDGALASARVELAPTWARAPAAGEPLPECGFDRTLLFEHDLFRGAFLRIGAAEEAPLLPASSGMAADGKTPRILAVLDGAGTLRAPDCLPRRVSPGEVWLLPACLPTAKLTAEGPGELRTVEAVAG